MSILKSRNRILAVVLFGAGLLSVAALQQRGAAQENHPAAQATAPAVQNAAGPLPAQPGHIKDEEAEEHNVFRHTALVQSLARTFHMDVETTARMFEWVNAAIILLCIIVPLAKFLPKVMRKRSQTLNQSLEMARKSTADANTRLSAVESQLSRLDEEIAKIRSHVEEEIKQDEVRIKATIGEESARIVAAAEQEISSAAAAARRELRTFAADLAIEHAARQLTLTPDADRALISDFIREAGNGQAAGNGTGKGGQK